MSNLLQIGKDLASHGQVLIYLILLCSVISVAIMIDRIISFHKASLNLRKFMSRLTPVLKRDKIIEAISICDKSASVVARATKAGILKHDRQKEEICGAMREISRLEISNLEKYLSILGSIAYVAPLLGFLGTVLGMIEIFLRTKSLTGPLSPGDLSQGLAEALFTTAAGLAVMIPSILAYNYFCSRLTGIETDVEQAAQEISSIFARESPGPISKD